MTALQPQPAAEDRPHAVSAVAGQAGGVRLPERRLDDGVLQPAADRLRPGPAERRLGLAVPPGDDPVASLAMKASVDVSISRRKRCSLCRSAASVRFLSGSSSIWAMK
jgi:hypothetical protein